MHAGGGVSWRSNLQECTALSKTGAENIAASEATKEAIWLQRLTTDFKDSGSETVSTPTLSCDYTPCAESDHTQEDKAHRGTVSPYPGAHHGKEIRSPEDRHRAEHRQQKTDSKHSLDTRDYNGDDQRLQEQRITT